MVCVHAPAISSVRPRSPGDSGCDLSPERPLHFSEKVLPILHVLGIDSYLVVKKHQSMEAMLLYLGRWWIPPSRAGEGPGGAREEQLRQWVPDRQVSSEAGAGRDTFLHLGTLPRVSGFMGGRGFVHSMPTPLIPQPATWATPSTA